VDKFSVESFGDGWYLVSDGTRRWRVAVASNVESEWVFVNGQVARLDAAAKDAGRKRSRGRGDAGVMSPMPATVVAINAAPGQAVSQGDTLIVLEAMKMELPIKAPRTGVIKAVHCAKGDLVQPGVNLLEFEA
jgi:3-methylcrotonyl-CoA carboxylase alpha subunit